jgi:hypothetical protein
MSRAWLMVFCILQAGLSFAQLQNGKPLRFNLAKIGMVINGRKICEDKGRMQDQGAAEEMGRIIAAGTRSVPVLIGMITDARMAKTAEPIVCYWPDMAIGDIAFCLLEDLFMDANNGNSALPGASWSEMLGKSDNAAWDQLHGYIRKRGRAALQAKWQRLWNKYQAQIYWDANQGNFRLKAN